MASIRRKRIPLLIALFFLSVFFFLWLSINVHSEAKPDEGIIDDLEKNPMYDNDYLDMLAQREGRKMKILAAHEIQNKVLHQGKQNEIHVEHVDMVKQQDKRSMEEVNIDSEDIQNGVVAAKHIMHDRSNDPDEGDDYHDNAGDEKDEDNVGDYDDNLDLQENERYTDEKKSAKQAIDSHGHNEIKFHDKLLNPGTKSKQYVTSPNSLSFDKSVIKDCITRKTLGYLPSNLKTQSLKNTTNLLYEEARDREKSFHKVYVDRAWGKGWDKSYDRLDASGRGAQLTWAQELIATLHILINDIKSQSGQSIVKVLDIPCGDMAWMSRFLVTRNDIDYTGVDIVPELINNHKSAYKSFPWKFKLMDIVEDQLNDTYDIIINRMLLQHLYFGDIYKVLQKFSHSKSTFLVSTTSSKIAENKELSLEDNPGRVRLLNLEITPISLSPPLCLARDGPSTDFEGWNHFIGVWKMPLQQVSECKKPKATQLSDTEQTVFSCGRWS